MLLCVFIINNDVTYAVAPKVLTMSQICPNTGDKEYIVCKIKETFPEEPDVMLAIAIAESQLNNDAVGYNCYYEGKSTSCKKGDKHLAWSSDSGLFQIHKASEHEKTLEGNLQAARKLYDKRNKSPWCAYTSGAYLKYLPEARSMIK